MIPTRDIVVGDVIAWKEGVFGGSYKHPQFLGERNNYGIVRRESYGGEVGQHTFTIEILTSEGVEPISQGALVRRKGRTVYAGDPYREEWQDEPLREQLTLEKHERGKLARAKREYRRLREMNLTPYDPTME